jgi:4-hydroxy-tetrahydrodipicolinate reductase
MTRIVIAGGAGRMGQALITCSRTVPELCITGVVEAAGHPALGRDAGTVAGRDPIGVPVTSELRAALEQADVLIDFTLHTTAPVNVGIARELRRAAVIGATGLTAEESERLARASADIPIVWAPNMSLGVNLLFAAVRKAAEVLGRAYSCDIDETHHVHKKDAPSGTALRLGEKVAEGWNTEFQRLMSHEEGGDTIRPAPGHIVIHSHREGEVVGDHTVRFDIAGESVAFTHRAFSREAFAMGALKAAAWVVRQRPRLYDMQDVLGLR